MTQRTAPVPLSSFSTFGELLIYLRRRAGLTQAALAQRVGYSETQISRLEQNRRQPQRAVILAQLVPGLQLESEPAVIARLLELAERQRGAGADAEELSGAAGTAQPEAARAGGGRPAALTSPAVPRGPAASQAPAVGGASATEEDAGQMVAEPAVAVSRLSVPLTPLIGRETELAEIQHLLTSPHLRLLTLTGPGGIGKTRLALQAGADMQRHFADGVAFANLAPLTSADQAPGAIAAAVDVTEAPGRTLTQALVDRLHARQMLLILDNFEHVLPAAALVDELLAACPGLKALVTSRETIGLLGEQLYPVPPLALPNLTRLPPLDELARVPAVALFLQRGRAVRPDLALTLQVAPVVAEIAARLDGLPLAIELAAARSRYLAPVALLARLVNSSEGHSGTLRMLTGGPRDVPARQQTLRNTIAWSYDLLDPAEQSVFRRLALFAGDFSLAAAEAVCAAGSGPATVALEAVAALLDKSLIRRVAPGRDAEDPRFEMLAVVREFALELLEQDDHCGAVRAAFAAYYRTQATLAGTGWLSPEQGRWLAWLRTEEANLRQALAWSLATDADPELAAAAAAILVHLDRYLRQLPRIGDTRRWIEQTLACRDRLSWEEQARLLTMAGYYGMLAGAGTAYVMAQHEEALALARRVEDEGLLIDVLEPYGIDAAKAQMDERAMDVVGEAMQLERHRSGGMSQRLTVQLNILSTIYYNRDQYAEARAVLEPVLEFVRQGGNIQHLCAILTNLATFARLEGNFAADARYLREVWPLLRSNGDTLAIVLLLSSVAERALLQRHYELAVRLHAAEQAAARRMGFVFPPAYQGEFDGYVAQLREQLDEGTFAAAWAAGEATGLEEAVDLGLSDD